MKVQRVFPWWVKVFLLVKINQIRDLNVFHLKYLVPFFLVVTIVTLFKFSAGTSGEQNFKNTIAEEAISDAGGENVVIKTDKVTFTRDISTRSWPSEIPHTIPKFAYGKVASVAYLEKKDAKNWTIIFEKVLKTDLPKYKLGLEREGFRVAYSSYNDTDGSLTAKKGKIALGILVGEKNSCFTIDLSN